VEEIVVPSLTTAFYVNNAARNSHLVERRELTHVWLNHGDSEKPACYNPVHAIYDLLFAAGQAGVDRYARHGVTIPTEKFRVVGRPQVEVITPARGPVETAQPPTVLYAPTWQGPFSDSRVFSLPSGRQIVEALLARGARVVFRAHPFNYRYRECVAMIEEIGRILAADRAATGRDHLWGAAAEQEMTVEDCFNVSDAMISDVSAVVSDYLRSDKPFAIVSVGRTPDQLLVEAPAARAAYVLQEDLSNLADVCDKLLRGDPLADVRQETKVYYLGDFPEPYADGFLDAARAVVDRRDGVSTDV
jgi:CDP-glycerol glycerophosphotransferase (TagB/SpsB family)